MERVTGESTATATMRTGGATVERRERAAADERDVSVPEANGVAGPSIATVAARAEEGRIKSLSTLANVTQSIDDAVEVLNQALSLKNTAAVIRRDEELNRYLVTIKDKESGEIVREIPDEALLKFARNLQELRGILFDEST